MIMYAFVCIRMETNVRECIRVYDVLCKIIRSVWERLWQLPAPTICFVFFGGGRPVFKVEGVKEKMKKKKMKKKKHETDRETERQHGKKEKGLEGRLGVGLAQSNSP